MNLRRTGVLLGKEFRYGARGYILIIAIVLPLVLSLLVNLIFGTLFSSKARLGIYDEGASRAVALLEANASLTVRVYHDDESLRGAVTEGRADVGVVFPAGLDTAIIAGTPTDLTGYVWGEGLAKDQVTIGVALTDAFRRLAGLTTPVTFNTVTLGGEAGLPWNDRLMPLIVLLAVFLGGLMLPATSVIMEKGQRTLSALLVTPLSSGEVFFAKGSVGFTVALFMGVLMLVINRAFGLHPGLLVLVLAMGGVMAVETGLLLGVFVKDFTTLFAIWKSGGIILIAPVIVYLFPSIPHWVGNIFPTYYFVQPLVDISQGGGGWPEIAVNVAILAVLDILLLAILGAVLRRTRHLAA
jgi:ABC-2 type transport system permease protein